MNAHPRRLLRRPASLRGRVVLGVLAVLLVLLTTLFTVVDVLLTAKLHADLRARLTDRVVLAEQLDGALSAQQLVDRLRGDGVTAQLCSQGSCVDANSGPPPAGSGRAGPPPGRLGGAPPLGPKARAAASSTPVQQAGPVLFVRTTLPSSRQVLTLSVDSTQVGTTLRGLIGLEVIGGLIALALAALLLVKVVGTALRPLDHMTSLARQIAGGDRGRRLRTGRPDTELGRTATAFDAMLDELESALTAASEAEARLRAFLSDVSHELRTPLAGVQATTETLLRDDPERAGRERAYVTLVRETRRANRLVEDLLTVTRLDTGMRLSAEMVELSEVVHHEVERLALLQPDLHVACGGLEAAVTYGDPERLGQIVANLLDNARAAAGRHGSVQVEIAMTGSTLQVDVTDSGPGVPAADRERIFERLVRLDASRARTSVSAAAGRSGGFGLGLSIARALARAHGGDLVCRPARVGQGATFRLSLPAGVGSRTISRMGGAPSGRPGQRSPRPTASERPGRRPVDLAQCEIPARAEGIALVEPGGGNGNEQQREGRVRRRDR